ncbi:MAG: dienelactone hydrolase family protein [Gemmatimonadota bacterium]|jgi:carboxymethylenebutenolidase
MVRRLSPFVLPIALLAAACAPSDDEAPATQGAANAAPAGPRVAFAPTAEDALPAAVLGTAPPPAGTAVHYFAQDTTTTGYLAVPEGEGPFPALILIHEWNGLGDRVRQVADALAAEGYIALAADLYSGRTGSNPDENVALMTEVNDDPATMIANLNAAVTFLRARPDVTGRIGAMGWCFGGGVALSFGLDGENHDATAIFYGRLIDDPARLASLSHEIYGTFAGLDQGISREQVDGFARALREAGIPNDIHIYDDVQHGFWLWVDRDPDALTAPALDAWQRLKAYLARTLR